MDHLRSLGHSEVPERFENATTPAQRRALDAYLRVGQRERESELWVFGRRIVEELRQRVPASERAVARVLLTLIADPNGTQSIEMMSPRRTLAQEWVLGASASLPQESVALVIRSLFERAPVSTRRWISENAAVILPRLHVSAIPEVLSGFLADPGGFHAMLGEIQRLRGPRDLWDSCAGLLERWLAMRFQKGLRQYGIPNQRYEVAERGPLPGALQVTELFSAVMSAGLRAEVGSRGIHEVWGRAMQYALFAGSAVDAPEQTTPSPLLHDLIHQGIEIASPRQRIWFLREILFRDFASAHLSAVQLGARLLRSLAEVAEGRDAEVLRQVLEAGLADIGVTVSERRQRQAFRC